MLQNSNAIEDGGYVIARSLRFSSASSQYLSRTPSVAGNQTTWTWSGWVKRGSQGAVQGVFDAYLNSSNFSTLFFTANNTLYFYTGNSSPSFIDYSIQSNAVFRDSGSWYHIVLVLNTSSLVADDRCVLYINGQRQSITNPDGAFIQNATTYINSTNTHNLGRRQDGGTLLDGYLSEVYFIDGQALPPSSFGENNSTTGQWVAKKYTGTYGTNGFYLDFKDGTSTTTISQDKSGNINNWTPINFTRSAGVNDCWMLDVPSGNGSTGVQPSSNYATLNPIKRYSANLNFSKGNLTVSDNSASISTAISSFFLPTTGKYYFEVTTTIISGANGFIGVATETTANGNNAFQTEGRYRSNGDITNLAGTLQTGGTSYTSGDVVGVAVDVDNGTVQFYKNNVAQGATPSFTFTTGTKLVPYIATDNNTAVKTFEANFGQRSFTYTPPTGFKALCTSNLPTPSIKKPSEHFDILPWVSTATVKDVTGIAFQPDLVWVKSRSSGIANEGYHHIVDSVRGAGKVLSSNTTDAEYWVGTNNSVQAFLPTGFTAGDADGQNGNAMITWLWKGAGAAVTNNVGSISSQVSANPTAGFSIVTYTGTGANATVGHGLGVAPKLVIVKDLTNGARTVDQWPTYHASAQISGADQILYLNSTIARATASVVFNNIVPTSTVFSLGSWGGINFSGDSFVAYCFAEIAGYSKFGSYTGNGSADGPFVNCGFRPRFILIKRIDTTANWRTLDSTRDMSNVSSLELYPNLSNAEVSFPAIDFISNGFKIRNTDTSYNASGGTYIYMAFAETSFQYSNAR